ncbi:MAG: Spi family protease inhibitor [Bacteroidetes bacterium]|nr:Spi family protease inhibitor [Bacteroidota bacterium]
MKKLTSLLIMFVIGISLANATTVNAIAAKKIAEDFFKQVLPQDLSVATLTYIELSANGEPVYYVFNVNEGHVVVAAADDVLPIISYSTEGKFIAPTTKAIVVTIDKWAANSWATQSSKG